MNNRDLKKLLAQYNSLYKELDEVYHALARHYGLSNCSLWILCIIREADENLMQNKICEMLSLSKQTVNSALKKLEKEGYITLESYPGNQKNKLILLTNNGELFAEKTVDKVIEMEQVAFGQFSDEELSTFLVLSEKHVRHLQTEARKILNLKH